MRSSPLAPSSAYLPHVDGLRAVAVLAVLFFHVDMLGFSGGFVGVDVFFVISGFLITRLIKDEVQRTGGVDFKRFYFRRMRRLFPALAATLLMTTMAACLLLSPAHLYRYGAELASAVLSVSNFYFLVQADYFDTSALTKPLLHTWSLSVEEQFYLLWPISLLLLLKLKPYLIPLLLLLVASLSLLLNYLFADGDFVLFKRLFPALAPYLENGQSTIFFLLPFRVFEFALGALAVWWPGRIQLPQLLERTLAALGLLMVIAAVALFDERTLFPAHNALLPCIGTVLLIRFGHSGSVGKLLTADVLVRIGLYSYSLYLVHWPITVFTRYISLSSQFSLTQQLFILFTSALAALAMYRYIEVPCRSNISGWSGPRWLAQTVATAMLVCIGGVALLASEGWRSRTDATLPKLNYAGSGADFQRAQYGGAGYPYYGATEDASAPDVVLMGDSHARHYAEGLHHLVAEEMNRNLFIAAGTSCLHLPQYTRISPGKNWDRACSSALQRALKLVKSAAQPPVVIVSHAWLYQQDQAGRLNHEGERIERPVSDAQLLLDILALKRAVAPAKLVLIGNVPSSDGVDLLDVLTRPTLSAPGEAAENYVTTPFTEGEPARNAAFNRKLAELAQQSGAFTFLDPFEALCDSTGCVNVLDNANLVYSDPGHLSLAGSLFVVKHFREVLKKVIDGPPEQAEAGESLPPRRDEDDDRRV